MSARPTVRVDAPSVQLSRISVPALAQRLLRRDVGTDSRTIDNGASRAVAAPCDAAGLAAQLPNRRLNDSPESDSIQ